MTKKKPATPKAKVTSGGSTSAARPSLAKRGATLAARLVAVAKDDSKETAERHARIEREIEARTEALLEGFQRSKKP